MSLPLDSPDTHIRLLIGDLFINIATLQAQNAKLEAEKAALLKSLQVSGASQLDLESTQLDA